MAAKHKHDAMMKKFNIEMRARTIAAPTNDKEVKEQLRNFEEPICLFGEGPSERRDRLKNILAKLEVCLTPHLRERKNPLTAKDCCSALMHTLLGRSRRVCLQMRSWPRRWRRKRSTWPRRK
jgi:hypothetical protein